MITQKRKELLAKNSSSGKIQALYLSKLSEIERYEIYEEYNGGCMYSYPNGNHCAVGACLTQDELDKINSNHANVSSVRDILSFLESKLPEYEYYTLVELQKQHDVCCAKYASDRQFWNFNKALNQVLTIGKIVKNESMEYIYVQYNDFFLFVDNKWVVNESLRDEFKLALKTGNK